MTDRERPASVEPSVGVSEPRRDLRFVDVTLLVVGSMIGADVYIVTGLGAAALGPAQIVAWLVAGVLTGLIALAFVQCAAADPAAGGSYAYARSAFGGGIGFAAGWLLYLSEWVALPVFPLAFVNYAAVFAPGLSAPQRFGVECALVAIVTGVNLVGVRSGGRVNDLLTIAKLLPLGVLIALGLAVTLLHGTVVRERLTPFAPMGWSNFGGAVVPIFWAYAGFELAALPAGEMRDPARTLPRALSAGVAIVTVVYLLTNWAVVVALPGTSANSPRALADALGALGTAFGWGGDWTRAAMSLGALVSVAGVFAVFMLTLAWLSAAMATDGFFPRPFGFVAPRFGTPWVGLLAQAATPLIGAQIAPIGTLIPLAVSGLGVCYVLTSLAAIRLVQRAPGRALHLPALMPLLALSVLAGAYLVSQGPWRIALAMTAVLIGLGFALGRRRTSRAA